MSTFGLELAGADHGQCYPGVAVHFDAREGCRKDFAGVLTAVRGDDP